MKPVKECSIWLHYKNIDKTTARIHKKTGKKNNNNNNEILGERVVA